MARKRRIIILAEVLAVGALVALVGTACTSLLGGKSPITGGHGIGIDPAVQNTGEGSSTTGGESQSGNLQNKTAQKGDAVMFESFYWKETNSSAIYYLYEGRRTENGVHLEYSEASDHWNEDYTKLVPDKKPEIVIEGDTALYERICKIMEEASVSKWSGFQGANPPGILDGGGFGLEIVLTDGSVVAAGGSNNYPEGFGVFRNGISEIFRDSSYENELLQSLPELVLMIGGKQYRTALEKTIPSKELADLLSNGEKVASFLVDDGVCMGYELPDYLSGRDEDMEILPGDVVLAGGDQIRIFYAPDQGYYTRIGHLEAAGEELQENLPGEGGEIKLHVEYGE